MLLLSEAIRKLRVVLVWQNATILDKVRTIIIQIRIIRH